ncbi:MAG: flagellar assembly protein FliX [Bdellovibrionales bacterium]
MIEKIDGLGNVRTPQPVKRVVRTGASGGAGFSRQLEESGETGATSSIASASAVSGILNVQEVDDALAQASRGKMRAEDILNRLEDLRIELLEGGISREKLLQLSRIVNLRRAQIKDPRLGEILDAIDLRAQVELAKYMPA